MRSEVWKVGETVDKEYKLLITKEGKRIFYFENIPLKPKAIILINHGYGGHAGQYMELSKVLSQKGYGCCSFDHSGHGRSEEERGHLQEYEVFLKDLHEMVMLVKCKYPNVSVYTLGHSMGGLITFVYGILYPQAIKGQIFIAPALGMPWGTNLIPAWFYKLVKRNFSRLKIYPIIKRPASRNPAFKKALKDDPYTLKYATAGFFYEFIYRGIAYARLNASKYKLPCLFLHGESDKIIPYDSSVNIFNKILATDKTLKLYPKLYHELLQEPEKMQVVDDIVAWLEKRQ